MLCGNLVKPIRGHLLVIEGNYFVLNVLQRVVAFAANQYRVTRGGEIESGVNCTATIGANDRPVRTVVAVEYVVGNLQWMFAARIVTSNNGHVSCPLGKPTKQRSL
jgi:hypothetical protein